MMASPPANVQKRLENEANIWVATVRPGGRPHLTPVWFAWQGGKFYICIQAGSVKAHNLRQNPRVSLALEDGSKVVICEGAAAFILPPWPDAVAAVFLAKYSWNIHADGDYDQLLEITPEKWLTW